MTADRDIERLLDTWLADGPMQISDHVFDEAVGRVHRQRQRPAWRLLWKEPRMSAPLKAALAVAAVVVVFVAGFAMLGGSGGVIGGVAVPTALPTPSPSPTPSPPPLPAGPVEAGDYVARALADDPMAFTVTVPDRWTGFGGWAIYGPTAYSAPDGIGIAFMHDPLVTRDPCDVAAREPSPPPTAPSVDDVVAALSAREDLQVSGVTDTVLAGYSAKRLDIQLPAEPACVEHYVFAEPQGFYAQGPANHWRVWVADVDGETAVVVLTDYAGTSAENRAAAEAAIDSLRITP